MSAQDQVVISVPVSAEQNEWLQSLIDAGEFADSSAVFHQALKAFAFQRELELERLRVLYLEGKASRKARPLDTDAFLETLRQECSERERRQRLPETAAIDHLQELAS